MSEELDAETLALMRDYAGHDFARARKVRVEAFRESSIDSSLPEFMASINQAVPTDIQTEARVELEGDYETTSNLVVYYFRMETAKEVADRVRGYLKYARCKQREERDAYTRLKAKFENASGTD